MSNWYVVSLRPAGQHRRLLRIAESLGALGIGLPGLRLAAREDTPSREALDTALACRNVIFTSPSAVRFAVRLRMLNQSSMRLRADQRVFALGQASRAALRRAGIEDVVIPARADTEGLLDMPELGAPCEQAIGIVTAPGGRALLVEALRQRGARLAIAEVYARAPARITAAHVDRLNRARGNGAVCVTSGEALGNVLAALPPPGRRKLLSCTAVVSSARLETLVLECGFGNVMRAASPAPRALMEALCEHASGHGFG